MQSNAHALADLIDLERLRRRGLSREKPRLFGAFRRLHGADEVEGLGIGLTTAQRIVGRHGGRVWAEGAVEEGATSWFTLPQATHTETAARP